VKKYLLDTHVLLWMQDDNIALSKPARKILEDSATKLYLSIASLWEITIKQSLGKLSLIIHWRNLSIPVTPTILSSSQ